MRNQSPRSVRLAAEDTSIQPHSVEFRHVALGWPKASDSLGPFAVAEQPFADSFVMWSPMDRALYRRERFDGGVCHWRPVLDRIGRPSVVAWWMLRCTSSRRSLKNKIILVEEE